MGTNSKTVLRLGPGKIDLVALICGPYKRVSLYQPAAAGQVCGGEEPGVVQPNLPLSEKVEEGGALVFGQAQDRLDHEPGVIWWACVSFTILNTW